MRNIIRFYEECEPRMRGDDPACVICFILRGK